MIDKLTQASFDQAVTASRRKGTALIEELNARHLLTTRDVEHFAAFSELQALIAALDARGPAQLMREHHGRVYGTPVDMYNAIMTFAQRWVATHAGETVTRS